MISMDSMSRDYAFLHEVSPHLGAAGRYDTRAKPRVPEASPWLKPTTPRDVTTQSDQVIEW